ncbi:MAG: hypothetical protein ACRD1T_19385, partial [Acidimicrobiia bacterium]
MTSTTTRYKFSVQIGSFGISLAAALVALAGATGLAAQAQQNPYCGAFAPGEGAVVAPALSAGFLPQAQVATVQDDEAHGRRPVDELTISWAAFPTALGVECIWIGRVGVGAVALAEQLVPGTQTSVVIRPSTTTQAPEQVCYRLIPMSKQAMGNEVQLCATIVNGRLPIP